MRDREGLGCASHPGGCALGPGLPWGGRGSLPSCL